MSSKPEATIEIRTAGTADADLLAVVGRETFLHAFQGRIEQADLIAFANKRYGGQQQLDELAQPGAACFIASVEADVAGYARLVKSAPPSCVEAANVIELERLYLYPQWFGTGIARALLDRCLSEARKRSCEAMWLDVWDQNHRAEAFYRKHGFSVVGDCAYQVGTIIQKHLLMFLALT